jgi:hypothetical protein
MEMLACTSSKALTVLVTGSQCARSLTRVTIARVVTSKFSRLSALTASKNKLKKMRLVLAPNPQFNYTSHMTQQQAYQKELKLQARKLLSYRFNSEFKGIPVQPTRKMLSVSNKIAKLLINSSK